MKTRSLSKSVLVYFISVVALAFVFATRADFNPVPMTPASFTQDIIVEGNAAPERRNYQGERAAPGSIESCQPSCQILFSGFFSCKMEMQAYTRYCNA
jgi:hypothetical protein